MTKIPQTTGDTYADIVTWKWNRSFMQWTTELRDGTELIVQLHTSGGRGGRHSYWTWSMYHQKRQNSRTSHTAHQNADLAQNDALDAWRSVSDVSVGRRTTNIKQTGPSRRRNPKRRRGTRR